MRKIIIIRPPINSLLPLNHVRSSSPIHGLHSYHNRKSLCPSPPNLCSLSESLSQCPTDNPYRQSTHHLVLQSVSCPSSSRIEPKRRIPTTAAAPAAIETDEPCPYQTPFSIRTGRHTCYSSTDSEKANRKQFDRYWIPEC